MFENRVAFITGGTRGIGKAIAKELASKGVNIALAATKPAADEVVKEIESLGVKCAYYKCDVSSMDEVTAVVKQIVSDFGKIDILVNNAGVTADGLLISMSEADFDKVISINLKGAYHTMKACMRTFMRNRYGRIVNIASVVGLMGNVGQANYAASKAGIVGLTKSIAKEYASKGVTCNAVAPGYICTEMTDAISDSAREKIASMIPLGTLGRPEDVAKAVAFLADDESGYITGEVLKVDGGMYI